MCVCLTDNDETAYREEVRELAVWCQDKNFSLNVSNTKELIVDYRTGCILTGCITAWYGNCSASDWKTLQMAMLMAQYITGAKLPAIQDLQFKLKVYIHLCQIHLNSVFHNS